MFNGALYRIVLLNIIITRLYVSISDRCIPCNLAVNAGQNHEKPQARQIFKRSGLIPRIHTPVVLSHKINFKNRGNHTTWPRQIITHAFVWWTETINKLKLDVTCFIISLFHYLLLNMFRMLVHPSSGACDLFVDLFHVLYCSCSMCVGVMVWLGWGGVVSLRRLKHCNASACIRIPQSNTTHEINPQ